MDAALARAIITAAARRGLSVVLSGGEPMLHAELVMELARIARPYGVSVAVSTNGFWAESEDSARVVMERLRDAGVDTLLLSTDVFHVIFIPSVRVEWAARAARAAGLNCEIALPSRPDDAFTGRLAEQLADVEGVIIKRHDLSATGRARHLPPSFFREAIHDRPCSVIGQLAVTPAGLICACCAGAIDAEPGSPLSVSLADGGTLETAIHRFGADPLLQDIQGIGPLRAAVWEKARHPHFQSLTQLAFADICAACRFVCARAASARRISSRIGAVP